MEKASGPPIAHSSHRELCRAWAEPPNGGSAYPQTIGYLMRVSRAGKWVTSATRRRSRRPVSLSSLERRCWQPTEARKIFSQRALNPIVDLTHLRKVGPQAVARHPQ